MANCRRLDRSAAAKAHLDFVPANQDGDYACAIGETHDLLNNLGIVFGADLFVGDIALLQVLFGRSTEGTPRGSVNNNLLWRPGNASPLIKIIELLNDKLNVLVTLIIPDARFVELAIRLRLREVKPN